MNMRVKLFFRFLLISFLITAVSACQLFENDVDDFMQKYTETAAIEDHEFSVEPYLDINENLNISSKEDISVTMIMRNPKKFNMIPAAQFNLLDATINREKVDIFQVDEETVKLILPQAFLVPSDEGQNISADISLYEPMSGRTFDIYTVELYCNSVPPLILNPTVVNNAGSTFVIAFDMPNDEDAAIKHKDLAFVEIDGVSYPVKVKTEKDSEGIAHAVYQFSDPKFSRDWSSSYIIINQKDFTPNRNSVYFETGIPFSAVDKEFTLCLRDAAGLESSVKASTSISKLVKPLIKDQNGSVIRESGIAGIPFDEATKTGKITIVPPTQDHLGNSVSGATVHYTVYEATGSGLIYTSGSSTENVTLTLPQNTYRVEAYATLTNYENSATRTVKFRFINNILYVKAGFVNGDGSEGAPFATINEALADVNSRSNHETQFTIFAEDDGANKLNDDIVILPNINTDLLTIAKKSGAESATIKSIKLDSSISTDFRFNMSDITVNGSATEGISLNSPVLVNLTRINVSNSSSDGLKISGATVTYENGTISGAGGNGINLTGGSLTCSGINISQSTSNGISYTGGSLSCSGMTIANSGSNGIYNTAGSLTLTDINISHSGANGINSTTGNLALTDTNISYSGENGINNAGGNLTCENVNISNSTADGIHSTVGDLTYSGGQIKDNTGDGIDFNGGTLTYNSGTISSNGGNGISAGSGQLTYAEGTISGSGANGIQFTGTTLTYSSGTISNSGTNGILFNGTGLTYNSGTISNSGANGINVTGGVLSYAAGTISGNTGNGLWIHGAGSHVYTTGTISGNTQNGIRVENGNLTYHNGIISNNGECGISFEGQQLTLHAASISGSGSSGIYLANGSLTIDGSASITSNEYGITTESGTELNISAGLISNNTSEGIVLTASTLTLTGGSITENHNGGISVSASSAINMRGNPVIKDNTKTTAGTTIARNLDLSYGSSTLPITITGSLTSGCEVGITTAQADVPTIVGNRFSFTTGYGTYNSAAPSTYFRSDKGIAIVANGSGSSVQAALTCSGTTGTFTYDATDFNFTFAIADELGNSGTGYDFYSGFYTGIEKKFVITPTVTRTETVTGGATPTTTGLTYNASEHKLYDGSGNVQGAGSAVTWTAELFSSGYKVADLSNTITDTSSGIKVGVNATLTGSYTLKITASYMGIEHSANYTLNCSKNADNTAYLIKTLTSTPADPIEIEITAGITESVVSSELSKVNYALQSLYSSNPSARVSLVLPDWLTVIPANSFRYSNNLAGITIPATVTEIKASAFAGCSSLATVNFNGTVDNWKNVTRADGWHNNVPSTTVATCSDGNAGLDAHPDYVFNAVPTTLPADTTGAAGDSKTYIYFGDWPKTIKASAVTIDESNTMTRGGNTYYMGSDGFWYAKCSVVKDSTTQTHQFSDNSDIVTGQERYFKVEPIKWCVLSEDFDHDGNPSTPGKWLIVADYAIQSGIPFYGQTSTRTLGSQTIYSNNYEYSNIRAWLNGIQNQYVTDGGTAGTSDINWTGTGFFQSAFTDSAQARIATTTVINNSEHANPASNPTANDYSAFASNPTDDKVFLLSRKEFTTTSYGLPSYTFRSTDWVLANTAWARPPLVGDNYVHWILRSPDYYSNQEIQSESLGSIISERVSFRDYCIVPAMCIEPLTP